MADVAVHPRYNTHIRALTFKNVINMIESVTVEHASSFGGQILLFFSICMCERKKKKNHAHIHTK